MPSVVICDQGHRGESCREAAIRIARFGSLEPCPRKDCGAKKRYLVTQSYPGKGKARFELEHVIRLYTDEEAADEGYDPMLFVLRRVDSGQHMVWLFYWTVNRHGAWHVGQFPPLLSTEEYQKLSSAVAARLQSGEGIAIDNT